MENSRNKFVFSNKEKGPILLKITLSDCLNAGGEFKLFSKDDHRLLDTWKVTMDSSRPYERMIKSPTANLQMAVLVWQLLSCSSNVNVRDGAIKIEFFQAGTLCKQTYNTEAYFKTMTPCAMKMPISYKDAVTFVVKQD